jgi:hypothetical protein
MKKDSSLSERELGEYHTLLEGYNKDFEECNRCARELAEINDEIQRLELKRADLLKDYETRNENIRNGMKELTHKILSHPDAKETYLKILKDT